VVLFYVGIGIDIATDTVLCLHPLLKSNTFKYLLKFLKLSLLFASRTKQWMWREQFLIPVMMIPQIIQLKIVHPYKFIIYSLGSLCLFIFTLHIFIYTYKFWILFDFPARTC
jgi:hypothetical protein